MTYDSQVDATIQTAHEDLRDKVGGMTNWAVENDSLTSGHLALETAVSGEYIVIESQMLGDGSTANQPYEVLLCSSYTDASTYTSEQRLYREYWQNSNSNPTNTGDSVQYWLQYSDTYGFLFYFRRNEGDGSDGAFFVGAQQYDGGAGTQYWEPRNANSFSGPLPHYGMTFMSSTNDNLFYNNLQGSHQSPENCHPPDASQHGRLQGMLNPDSSFNNYVWYSNVVLQDDNIANAETNENPVFARVTDPIWLDERSASDLNTGDVVQNDSGGDEWEILEYHGVRVAVRMI